MDAIQFDGYYRTGPLRISSHDQQALRLFPGYGERPCSCPTRVVGHLAYGMWQFDQLAIVSQGSLARPRNMKWIP